MNVRGEGQDSAVRVPNKLSLYTDDIVLQKCIAFYTDPVM